MCPKSLWWPRRQCWTTCIECGGVFEGAPETSRKLALEFEIQADSKEVHFFDAASVCACDPADGFHTVR